jgi:hypothetical protein
MPADLDQFGREYSHGAVIGGKGFVQLRHMAANGPGFVNQVNLKARRGQIKRGLNTADPTTDDHDISKIGFRKTITKLIYLFFFHVLLPQEAGNGPFSQSLRQSAQSLVRCTGRTLPHD